jgi:hypothetical protein
VHHKSEYIFFFFSPAILLDYLGGVFALLGNFKKYYKICKKNNSDYNLDVKLHFTNYYNIMINESTLLTSNTETKGKILKDNNRFEVAQETSKDFINIFQKNIDNKKSISFPDNIASLLQDDLKQFSFKNFDNYTVNENTDSSIIWNIFKYDLPIEKVQELEDSINYTLNSISELHKTT